MVDTVALRRPRRRAKRFGDGNAPAKRVFFSVRSALDFARAGNAAARRSPPKPHTPARKMRADAVIPLQIFSLGFGRL